jgi:hypothetical protein
VGPTYEEADPPTARSIDHASAFGYYENGVLGIQVQQVLRKPAKQKLQIVPEKGLMKLGLIRGGFDSDWRLLALPSINCSSRAKLLLTLSSSL